MILNATEHLFHTKIIKFKIILFGVIDFFAPQNKLLLRLGPTTAHFIRFLPLVKYLFKAMLSLLPFTYQLTEQ